MVRSVTSPSGRGTGLLRFINKHTGVYVLLGVLLLIAGVANPSFLAVDNSLTMLRQASALGIIAVGQLFVIVGGGVDLSVAATMQMAITVFMAGWNAFGAPGLVLGVIAALAVGMLIGFVNGLAVVRFHVQPLLTTLFTAAIVTGLRMIWVGVNPSGNVPDAIRLFGRDRTLGIPNAVVVLLVVALVAWVVLSRTVYGRRLIGVGTSYAAARTAGIRPDRTLILSYVASSGLAVVASIVLAGYVGFADQWIGAGYEFNSLIAAVIGGNYLGGGRGSVSGAVGGALVMTVVLNVVTLLGLSAPFQHIVSGVVLILALTIGVTSQERRNALGRPPRPPRLQTAGLNTKGESA